MHGNGCPTLGQAHIHRDPPSCPSVDSLRFSRSSFSAHTVHFFLLRSQHNSQFERLLLGYVDTAHINSAIIFLKLAFCSHHLALTPSYIYSCRLPPIHSPILDGHKQNHAIAMLKPVNNSLLFSENPSYFSMTHIFHFYSIFFTSDLLVLTF